MIRKTAQNLTLRREHYLKGIMRDIRKRFPSADFRIYRGPGLKHAWLYVYVSVKNVFDVLDSVGKVWDDALSNGHSITIVPLEPKGS